MVGPSSLLAQRAALEGPRLGRGRVSARPGRVGEKVAQSRTNPTIPREGCAKSSGGGERVGRGNDCGAGFSARGAPTMKQWSLDART